MYTTPTRPLFQFGIISVCLKRTILYNNLKPTLTRKVFKRRLDTFSDAKIKFYDEFMMSFMH